MVIEWLKVHVEPQAREQYIQKDAEIWTPALAQYPGFLNKEVWISPSNLSELTLVIRWESMDAWHSVPADVLERTETAFNRALGSIQHAIVESSAYQVRKY